MYFILSKLLIYLLYPLTWVFILLIIALVSKNARRKKRSLISGMIVLYLFSIPFGLDCFAWAWNGAYPPMDTHKTYSAAIVLGGFSSDDEHGNGHFNESADRFIQGLRLLSTGHTSHLLISGGNGNLQPGSFRESDWVKGQLKDLKVADSAILVENQSRNTIENAAFSKKVLDSAHLKPPYLLVTSAFHMRRAKMIFDKAGLNVVAYPCNYMAGDKKTNLDSFIPDAGAMGGWGFYLKEVVGYVVNSFKKA